ncbi:MAG: hypothetical protein Fur0032_11780 [Terrimicrobiaceae bacterium]
MAMPMKIASARRGYLLKGSSTLRPLNQALELLVEASRQPPPIRRDFLLTQLSSKVGADSFEIFRLGPGESISEEWAFLKDAEQPTKKNPSSPHFIPNCGTRAGLDCLHCRVVWETEPGETPREFHEKRILRHEKALASVLRKSSGESDWIILGKRGSFQPVGESLAIMVLRSVDWLHETPAPESVKCSLTPKEREVLRLLARGKSRKEAAAEMNVSPHTLAGYARRVYRFLNIHSQAELVRKFESGRLPDGLDFSI